MIKTAAIQISCAQDDQKNRTRALEKIGQAAENGANIILLPELFETPYFCKTQEAQWFEKACRWEDHPFRKDFEETAAKYQVVLPISFFEKDGKAFFNSVAVIDADGTTLGIYRKLHIPQGPGYEEKFYFSPGNLGPKVWDTRFGCIGIGICWDQWSPELARTMALMGAEILFYPTAIGSEPEHPGFDSLEHWITVQRGHAGSNMVPLVTANRIGHEVQGNVSLDFYGSSFIAGPHAEIHVQASRTEETIIYADFDLEQIQQERSEWGLFRDRRPDCYSRLWSL